MMAKTNPLQFVQQTRSEMAKVVWPTRREVMLTTVMVFIMAALTAIFFGLVDLGIRAGLQAMLSAVSKNVPLLLILRANLCNRQA